MRIEDKKAVYFVYSIVDEQGKVLEQSDLPIGYVHGCGSNILEKLEQAMQGHQAGDQLEVPIRPDDGFGDHDPSQTFTDDIENVPPQYRQLGAEVEFQNDKGQSRTFIVTKIEGNKLTVDGNHPLAGKNLVFHVTIRDVRDASKDEIRNGVPSDSAATLH